MHCNKRAHTNKREYLESSWVEVKEPQLTPHTSGESPPDPRLNQTAAILFPATHLVGGPEQVTSVSLPVD